MIIGAGYLIRTGSALLESTFAISAEKAKVNIGNSLTGYREALAFLGVIFIAILMFFDSLIKTLKYKTRPQETIIGAIVKNIGIIVLVWYLIVKGIN